MTDAPTTAHALAEQLRADINAGLWPGGAVLRQDELARRYGASRIPVREALKQLGAEGLVTLAPNRGACVAVLDAAEVTEIFELRLWLETRALRAALPNHTARTLVELAGLQALLDVEDRRADWIASDRRFHEALYAPSAQTRTLALIRQLRGQVERFLAPQLGPHSRREGWSDEHQALIDAVRQRDESRAVAVLTAHLRQTGALVCRHLAISACSESVPGACA